MILDLLDHLDGFAKKLNAEPQAFYAKLESKAPASTEQIDRLKSQPGLPKAEALYPLWTIAEGIHFEWFLKAAGAQAAGIDSRLAPSGQFHLLTPDEVIQEWSFLSELAGVTDDSLNLLPFAKLKPNGEVLALEIAEDGGGVVLVFLDLILSVVPLAESLDAWLTQRLAVYFEDSTLIPDGDVDPVAKVVLDAVSAKKLIWPPRGKRLL
ncbi:MAG: hypothetical protein VYA30_11860 [Myxococcota bacterium]|nr:hypothetical protein [Myxococcota bacterium]